jgi:hypothetical protein
MKHREVIIHDDATAQNSNVDEIIPPKPKFNNLVQAGKAVPIEVDDLLENQAIIA